MIATSFSNRLDLLVMGQTYPHALVRLQNGFGDGEVGVCLLGI